MQEMEALVHQLVAGFDENPFVTSRTLRELADGNWRDFTAASLGALSEDLTSRGARYLVSLLLRGDTLAQAICETSPFSIEQAATIAKLACAVDPKFEIQLAKRLTCSDLGESEAVRILKILEESSGRALLQP